jgi:hypothetical protein
MLQKLFVWGMALFVMNSSRAQDSSSLTSLSISGSGDVYYRYDGGKSKTNNMTSFTNSHNSFELGMASVKLNYKTPKLELVGDIGVGKRAKEFSYNDEGVLSSLKQLYITYNATPWLKLTAGSWATHVGYELVDPNLNRNYSMSYMFTNGPFFHTGVRADITHKSSGFMIGIANPTDFKYVPDGQINNKFLLAQYSLAAGEHFKLFLNYVSGKNVDTTKSSQYDLVLTGELSDKFDIAYNGTLNRTTTYLGNKVFDECKSWWGSAIYLNYDPLPSFGLSIREEYFRDVNRLKVYKSYLQGGSILATTLSANIKTDNLIIIPEVRMDRADGAIFTNAGGNPVKWSANFLLAAIYHF